jgi:transposase
MPAACGRCPPRRFPTDLTNAQWGLLAPLLPARALALAGQAAPPPAALVDAILYLLGTGCTWRALPDCYPHWRTVHHHFACWAADGTLAGLHAVLRGWVRAPPAVPWRPPPRSSTPSRCAPATGSRGRPRATTPPRRSMAANGTWPWTPVGCCWTSWSPPPAPRTRRRPAATVAPPPRPADHPAGLGRCRLRRQAGHLGPTGPHLAVQIVRKRQGVHHFEVLPRRWVVERTFSWLGKCRGLAVDYERKPNTTRHGCNGPWSA